jgi:ankyrin repeat protein
MTPFGVPELLAGILELLPDVRALRVCREFDRVVVVHPEYKFWTGYILGDVYRYGKPKMFESIAVQHHRLRIACLHGNLPVIKYMVGCADANEPLEYPLLEAIEHGHLEVVKFLVERGADIHARSGSALRTACVHGRFDVVRYLVECGADIHMHGEYPLLSSCIVGRVDLVEYLIELGAVVNLSGQWSHLIEIAARHGHLPVVQLLVRLGVSRENIRQAAACATHVGHTRVAEYLAGIR